MNEQRIWGARLGNIAFSWTSFRESNSTTLSIDISSRAVVAPLYMNMNCMASSFSFMNPRDVLAPVDSPLPANAPGFQHAMYSMVLKLYNHGRCGLLPKLITWRSVDKIADVV